MHVLPLLVIGMLAVVLWRPAPDPLPSEEQEAKIADLAARLGSAESAAIDIDDRLRSFGPFPPHPQASRALAEALIGCEPPGSTSRGVSSWHASFSVSR